MGKIKTTENSSKKEIIIEKAARLFREKGFKAASMRELASLVGVEAASLYNHIDSKNDLLATICLNIGNRYTNNIKKIETESSSYITKVEQLIRFHVNERIVNFEEVYVTDTDWRSMEEPYLSDYREMRRSYRKRFAAIVQKGIDAGEIKELDANSAVMIFINAIAAVDQWHRIIHKVNSEDLEENIVSILVDGIRKVPAR
ncbi:MAG TPA: TetR/AcrR family transcriptional regulator [Segetibacter sp.]